MVSEGEAGTEEGGPRSFLLVLVFLFLFLLLRHRLRGGRRVSVQERPRRYGAVRPLSVHARYFTGNFGGATGLMVRYLTVQQQAEQLAQKDPVHWQMAADLALVTLTGLAYL